jgi:hypothetical protein
MYDFLRLRSLSVAFVDIEECANKRARIEESTKSRVRFASFGRLEEIQPTISRCEMTDDEVVSCWWTSEDQKESRLQARLILKQAAQSLDAQDFVDTTVERAYQSACSAVYNTVTSPSQCLTNESVAQLCSDEAIVTSNSLRLWTVSSGPLQGLERRMMTKQRQARALNHRRIVLQTFSKSAMAMDSDDSSTCSGHGSVTAHDDEMVASVSTQSSAIARVYARMIGDADLFFVLHDGFISMSNEIESARR